MLTKRLEPIDHLQLMPGNNYYYEQKEVKVISYEFIDARCIIATNKGPIDFPWTDASVYLKNFLLIPSKESDLLPVKYEMSINRDTVGSLKEILMDNIKKIQANKEYIPQASEINNQVKSIIDLAKAEIDILKTVHGIK